MIETKRSLVKSARGIGARQVRFASGLILFAYLLSHFLNHALGNVSLGAMADGLWYHMVFWQSWPVTIVFYTAALAHMGLGLWALYARRQFRWRTIEATQLVFGLSIPLLIIAHIIGMRVSAGLFDLEKGYEQAFFAAWVAQRHFMWLLYAALIVSWIHGCIGIYFWLRIKPSFKRTSAFLLAIAVLIPTVAMLGLYQGGRSVARASASPEWRADNLSADKVGTRAQQAALDRIYVWCFYGYAGLIVFAFAARGVRAISERRSGLIKLSYGEGKAIRVPMGLSVLEASIRHNIPHSSACGGRARCSTCRIRIVGDHETLPPPSNREAFVLARIGAGDDPAVRLACQLRPAADLSFFPIFPANTNIAAPMATGAVHAGKERYVVSMFVDMRGSTKLAERLLPFDTVFIINRFLTAVSRAVVECGGQPNQFVGDGQLALFGLTTSRQAAARQAIQAASRIAAHIDELNAFLGKDVPEPLRFGIGIHGGEVIVGDIGSEDHRVFTALGDAVNVAARLQDMTKTLGCEVVISDEVCSAAGLPADALPRQDVGIRGRAEPLNVRTAASAASLSVLTDAFAVAAA
ncbi:adenylate/guanylate cyclase domain-containing protein [Afipia sp. TerB]